MRFARFTNASRADGPCKFGCPIGQPHVVLHALWLQLCDALITENHRRRIQRYIPGTDHHQPYPSRRQWHATAELRERVADVSLAVLRDRGHHRRHSVVPRVSLPDALVFSLRIRTGGPRAAHHRGTSSGCPPRLVFANLQDRVVLDLGRLALVRCEVPFRFFNLDIWAKESKTPSSFNLVWPRPHRFAELLELCVTGPHSRAREHLFKPDRRLGRSKFLMPSSTLLFQPTKSPCKALGPKLLRRTVG